MGKSIHRPEYEVLRRLLRAVRLQAGVTQAELSGNLGRSQSFVSDVERGVRRLDLVELRDICQSLGLDLVTLVQDFEGQLDGRRPRGRR